MTKFTRLLLCASSALVLTGLASCTRVPPATVTADRMEYGQVIADSWKRQTLLNVVRMRYADAPVFLDVASVIQSYTVGGTVNANATVPIGGTDSSSVGFGAEGTWSNSPTVTYQPVLGEAFTHSLLQPVAPVAVFQLIQGGWPAALVMKTIVRSINGLRNDSFGVPADPGYVDLVNTLTQIQAAGDLGIRVEATEGGGGVVVVMRQDMDLRLHAERDHARTLLGLEPGITEFQVAYGMVPRSTHEVALITRSMLELLLELGYGIDLPAGHLTSGRVTLGRGTPGSKPPAALARIRSGKTAPSDTYCAVPYKGYWYWIDDNDIASKRIFTFLLILFSLAETGPGVPGPVVTVPSR